MTMAPVLKSFDALGVTQSQGVKSLFMLANDTHVGVRWSYQPNYRKCQNTGLAKCPSYWTNSGGIGSLETGLQNTMAVDDTSEPWLSLFFRHETKFSGYTQSVEDAEDLVREYTDASDTSYVTIKSKGALRTTGKPAISGLTAEPI